MSTYQRRLAGVGPQQRVDEREPPLVEPLGLLKPVETAQPPVPSLRVTVDPNTGRKTATLTIEQPIVRALANSPEIRIVSFDPEIARQEVAKAAGDFDPTSFIHFNYDDQDNPVNSFFEPGESETRLYESEVIQRTILGSEWSASYGLSEIWDDLSYRTLPTRYEPMAVFELRQLLPRSAPTPKAATPSPSPAPGRKSKNPLEQKGRLNHGGHGDHGDRAEHMGFQEPGALRSLARGQHR